MFWTSGGRTAHSFDDMTERIKMVAIVYLQRSVLLSVANPLRSVCVCLLNDCHRCRSYSDVVGFVFPFIQRATRLMMTRGRPSCLYLSLFIFIYCSSSCCVSVYLLRFIPPSNPDERDGAG